MSAASESCTNESVQPQVLSAGHMTRRVRQNGRESEVEKMDILRPVIMGEKKKMGDE